MLSEFNVIYYFKKYDAVLNLKQLHLLYPISLFQAYIVNTYAVETLVGIDMLGINKNTINAEGI